MSKFKDKDFGLIENPSDIAQLDKIIKKDGSADRIVKEFIKKFGTPRLIIKRQNEELPIDLISEAIRIRKSDLARFLIEYETIEHPLAEEPQLNIKTIDLNDIAHIRSQIYYAIITQDNQITEYLLNKGDKLTKEDFFALKLDEKKYDLLINVLLSNDINYNIFHHIDEWVEVIGEEHSYTLIHDLAKANEKRFFELLTAKKDNGIVIYDPKILAQIKKIVVKDSKKSTFQTSLLHTDGNISKFLLSQGIGPSLDDLAIFDNEDLSDEAKRRAAEVFYNLKRPHSKDSKPDYTFFHYLNEWTRLIGKSQQVQKLFALCKELHIGELQKDLKSILQKAFNESISIDGLKLLIGDDKTTDPSFGYLKESIKDYLLKNNPTSNMLGSILDYALKQNFIFFIKAYIAAEKDYLLSIMFEDNYFHKNAISVFTRGKILNYAVKNNDHDLLNYCIENRLEFSYTDIINVLKNIDDSINDETIRVVLFKILARQNRDKRIIDLLIENEVIIGDNITRIASIYKDTNDQNLHDLAKYYDEVNQEDSNRFLPLFSSLEHNALRMHNFLLQNGADINKKSHNGSNICAEAIRKRNFDLVLTYLNNPKFDIKSLDDQDRNLLDIMVQYNRSLYLALKKGVKDNELKDYLKKREVEQKSAESQTNGPKLPNEDGLEYKNIKDLPEVKVFEKLTKEAKLKISLERKISENSAARAAFKVGIFLAVSVLLLCIPAVGAFLWFGAFVGSATSMVFGLFGLPILKAIASVLIPPIIVGAVGGGITYAVRKNSKYEDEVTIYSPNDFLLKKDEPLYTKEKALVELADLENNYQNQLINEYTQKSQIKENNTIREI